MCRDINKNVMESIYTFKVLLLGDAGVGKSALTRVVSPYTYLCHRNAPTEQTIGVDFAIETIQAKRDLKLRVHIWDTSGRVEYKMMICNYMRHMTAVVYVFDLSNPRSLANLEKWHQFFMENSVVNGVWPRCLSMVIGTKADRSDRRVLYEDGANMAHKIGAGTYVETSCMYVSDVKQIIETLAYEMYREREDLDNVTFKRDRSPLLSPVIGFKEKMPEIELEERISVCDNSACGIEIEQRRCSIL